jgi:hypothetical protein
MKPTIEIYGSTPHNYLIDHLSVSMEEGSHDLLTAYVVKPGVPRTDELKGAPAKITWGSGPNTTTSYGYVDTTAKITGDSFGWVIMVLGATSVMRSGSARSFRRSTPFQIASTVTSPYRMALAIDQYVSPLDNFMQTSGSDWAALKHLADQTGMALVGSNTSIRLIDVRRALGRAVSRPVPQLINPDSFVQMETPSPVGFDTYDFTGIDALGNNFSVSGGPSGGVKRHSGRNFASLDDALNEGLQWEDRQRKFVRALATFSGQTPTKVGDIIAVEGARWFVSKCEHKVSGVSSTSDVSMELHRVEKVRPASLNNITPPDTRLMNGSWISSKRYEVEL